MGRFVTVHGKQRTVLPREGKEEGRTVKVVERHKPPTLRPFCILNLGVVRLLDQSKCDHNLPHI